MEAAMKIVGKQGTKRYLIDVGTDERGVPLARVLDLRRRKLFKPFNAYSIVARGYWEEYDGDQSILPELLSQVEVEEEK
jgi:hypothetical protein